jgi:hypothetical protein
MTIQTFAHGTRLVVLLTLFGLLGATTAHGANYYVNAASGNDANAGTSSAAPWKTIQKAATSMPAGNTCLVAPGTYSGRVNITRSGTATAPLVFKANGAGVIVGAGFGLSGAKYVVIDGFEITIPRSASYDDWGIGSGVSLVNTQYCEVRNCRIYRTLREGIMIYGGGAADSTASSYNTIRNNTIEYAGGYGGITLNGAYQTIEGNDISHSVQHPLYPTLSTAGGADADGIKFCGRDIVIRGNHIHDFGPRDAGNVDPHVDALQTYGPAYNILIEGNHINLPVGNGETQAAMFTQTVQPVRDIVIKHNVVTAMRGFNMWGLNADTGGVVPRPRVTIANNTFYGVTDYDMELHDCPSSVVKNNMLSATGRYMSTDSSPATGNNGVPGTLTLRAGDIRIGDPMFVDPANRNFRLKTGSPLIDKGAALGYAADSDGTPIPQGSAPDIGAFEYEQGGGTADTTAPVIMLNGSATVSLSVGAAYSDAGATATDNVDGDITARIVRTGAVNTAAAGTYTLTYTVSDAAGNAATPKTRTVTVNAVTPPADTTAPVITLLGSASVTVSAGASYTDAGATATDNVDGDITSKIVRTGSVNTALPGTYTLTYNVKDAAGNAAASKTRTVTINDTTKPVITLLGSATVTVDLNATYTDAGATATDNIDGTITSRIVKSGTVDTTKAGTYTLTYNVSDNAGNAATPVTRTVQVGTATANAYYVNAKTGLNTNNGKSPSSAWKTIQKAANSMPAGATCYVAPGTYNERVTIAKSGTASSPTTFKASGPGVIVGRGFTVKGSSTVKYVVIDGFEITIPRSASYDTWDKGSGVALINTQYCVVSNCHIYRTLREGIMVYTTSGAASTGSSYNTIANNTIEYAGALAGITLNGAYNTVDGNDISHTIQHPLYPTLSTASGSDADGIQFFGRDHVFRCNYIHDITTTDVGNVDPHPDAFQTYGPAYNITIARNVIDLPINGDDNQAAMIEQMVKPVKDITFRYNVVTAMRGFNVWGYNANTDKVVPLYRVTVANNTFYGVQDYDLELHDCPSAVVKNNAFSASGRHMWTNITPSTARNAVPGSATLKSGDIRIGDPLFVDPANGDFHLRAGSPLINQGANLGLKMDFDGNPVPQGGVPDIGAFEYQP